MAHYAKLGQPDPEASNVTYQQWHPRELDESELWLAWDRPDSGIPDAHMECVSLIVIAYLSKALLTIVNRYLSEHLLSTATNAASTSFYPPGLFRLFIH